MNPRITCSTVLGIPIAAALMSAAPSFVAAQAAPAQPPHIVLGVDCARIKELGIDKQVNLRAAFIRLGCGLETPGQPGEISFAPEASAELAPPTNVNTITGVEVLPHVTQSESMVWSSDGNTIVVNYNDSRTAPSNYSGVSLSIDGGNTFTRLDPSPFASGHGTNYGDPILVYNASLGKWFAGDLATGCGGQGIGLWTSFDGFAWTTGACAHTGTNDDRESMWVDNSPASPFYGRMYISWNNFAFAAANIFVTHSDDGIAWTVPVQVNTGATFIRNVQLTGSEDGTVFIAGMNEGGGSFNPRTNLIYRSVDGGVNWTPITMGAAFAPPGDSLCSNAYFARIFPIWRHMGWGQPGVGPGGIVHYAYARQGVSAADPGDIHYTRSLDNGSTWSSPLKLNTDIGGLAQWMPSLSVTSAGHVQVYWYDRRNSTDGQNYEIWSRQSTDNGATWLPDEALSTVLIPQPEQPDGNVQACYAGDYNYATALGNTHYAAWTDGRVPVSGHFQQDVFFAAISAISGASFSVALAPASLTIPSGGSGASTTTVTSTGGFSSAVTLSCGGQPPGVTCAFVPNPVTPPPDSSTTSALTINVATSVAAGNYSFNVVGTSGALSRTATMSLQVTGTGSITITAPNGGENWPIGRNRTITWTSSGVSSKVKIDLSRNGGSAWEPVVASTPNTGKKTWKVTGPATTQGRIRVCDLSGVVCDTSDANFTIQ